MLVTSTEPERLTLAHRYRARADAEHHFDELKPQWRWGGVPTQDLARCRLRARRVALVYDWWTLVVRLAQPTRMSRRSPVDRWCGTASPPHAARWTAAPDDHQHACQARRPLQAVLTSLAGFLRSRNATTEPWTDAQRLRAILTRAFAKFMLATAVLTAQFDGNRQPYCFF